jgi:hypothetical protein
MHLALTLLRSWMTVVAETPEKLKLDFENNKKVLVMV